MYEEIFKSWLEYTPGANSAWKQIYEHQVPEWVWCLKDNGTDCFKIHTYGKIQGQDVGEWDEEAGTWLPSGYWNVETVQNWDGYYYSYNWENINHKDMVLVWTQRKYEGNPQDNVLLEHNKFYYKDGHFVDLVDVKFDPIKDNINPWLMDIVNGEFKGAYV